MKFSEYLNKNIDEQTNLLKYQKDVDIAHKKLNIAVKAFEKANKKNNKEKIESTLKDLIDIKVEYKSALKLFDAAVDSI